MFAGFLRQTDGRLDTVAIKMLKDHANTEAKEDFMREVEIMTYFRHENILTLIGICPQGKIRYKYARAAFRSRAP